MRRTRNMPGAPPRIEAGRVSRLLFVLAVLFACGPVSITFPVFLGSTTPESFDLCEEPLDQSGAPRLECQAGDLRFQIANQTGSQFGFSVATGELNGDTLVDLVVGDPARNRVYIFYGRASVKQAYGLLPDSLNRGVNPDTQADVVLWRDPSIPGQVKNFGYSVAISQGQTVPGCTPSGLAAALAIGAPGVPGTTTNAPGTVFHIPAGGLCRTPSNPATTQTIDPATLGTFFTSPDPGQNDLFGYSTAFGRVLSNSGLQEDLVVGAIGALGGAGRVTAFPVTAGVVSRADGSIVRIEGQTGEGVGEAIACGDLDSDFDATTNPRGKRDDLAIGAVGNQAGKVIMVQGPVSPTGGLGGNGVYHGADTPLRAILGEITGDYFGFSVAISAEGRLAVGGVLADNIPPVTSGTGGGDKLTNAKTGQRLNAGKVYVWDPALLAPGPDIKANTAKLVVLARRSGDQLGFSVAFGDVDGSGKDDLLIAARREDGSGLKVNEIDEGTLYVILDSTSIASPVDMNLCATNSDCTGVNGVDVMIFGGDRSLNQGDEIGYALATGNFNGDKSDDIFVSSLTHGRVYAVTLEDTDGDRRTQGRNIRDEDDDGDGDPDATDCSAQNASIHAGATEITCNGIDENCNGMGDDAPDTDGDGFDVCGSSAKKADCDDHDLASFPGAAEVCDGNDNDCNGSVPSDERDPDGDHYVGCSGWSDTQGDQPAILGGGDCSPSNADTFPGAAPKDSTTACMRDRDKDGYGDILPGTGVTPGSDCNDQSAQTFPGAAPKDNATACLKDADGDGYGDTSVGSPIVKGTDCNDADPRSFPGAPELCDGNDNACAGAIPAAEKDPDNDRYVACTGWADTQNDNPNILGGGDCDPADGKTFPGAAPKETQATACMTDKDGDDYGDMTPASAGITPGTDCDDDSPTAAATFPGAAAIDGPLNCMKDSDGDDYGDQSVTLPIVPGTDCNDASASQHPGAAEIPDDSIDQDCSGADKVTCFVDADHDGYGSTTTLLDPDGNCTGTGESPFNTDCNDNNPNFAPGKTDIPDDGVDQDCNGHDTVTCIVDADKDGFGTSLGTTVLAPDGHCDAAQGEASNTTDCNDADPNTHPGATERCDGNNNACTGAVPVNETDADGDGYVACSGWSDTQGDNPGILGGGDCAPTDPYAFPGAAPKETFSSACMKDRDGDDYGDINPPAGVVRGTDCDDSPSGGTTFPGAAPHDGPLNCMKDADGDDYGDASVSLPVVRGTDCNDGDANTHPGAAELCDGNNNSCGATVPANETDPDGDGYVACTGWSDTQGDNPGILGGGDCAPSDPFTFPGAAPKEAFATACMKDKDGDDYGDQTPPAGVTPGSDCDDNSPTAADTFPGAAAIDGPLNCMKDSDHDDYGDSSVSLPIVAGTDCADNDPSRHPLATEVCGDGIDSDCDGQDPICGPSSPLVFLSDPYTVIWIPSPPTGTGGVNVYRGDLETLRSTGVYTQDPGIVPSADRFCQIALSSLDDHFLPIRGQVVFYLTSSGQGSAESSLGYDSAGVERRNTRPCQ